jgi:hypothetical protein
MDRLEQKLPHYVSGEMEGVLIVEPSVLSAGHQLMSIFKPDLGAFGRGATVTTGAPSTSPFRAWDTNVNLSLRRVTIADVLTEIVRQVPGLVWMIVHEPGDQPRCMLRWWDSEGALVTSFNVAR